MKVRIIENKSYVGLDHIIGNVYEAVRVSGDYGGYYVDIPMSSTKTASLYFLAYEVEEVHQVDKTWAIVSITLTVIAIVLVIVAICNQIIN